MLLFSRAITLAGNPRKTMPWAMEMNQYVRGHSDVDLSLWSYTYGRPLGTVAWYAVVESQAALAEATAKLETDDGYFDLIDKADEFTTQPGTDTLLQLASAAPQTDGAPLPVGSVAIVNQGTAFLDRIADALAWSVEIAEFGSGLVGTPVSVWTSVYGQMGQITWIAVHPDLASAEAGTTKLESDPGWLSRVGEIKELFVPASGQAAQAIKLA